VQSLGQDLKRTQDIAPTHTGIDGEEDFDGGDGWARGAYGARDFHLRDLIEDNDDDLAFVLIRSVL
jgi:hypothetical protein